MPKRKPAPTLFDQAAPPQPAAGSPPEPFRVETPTTRWPEIENCGELAEALRVVATLDARRKTVEAERDAAVHQVEQQTAAKLHVVVDGERITFDEWRANIIEAIERFVPKHKPEVFTDGKQTVRFPAGQVSYKRIAPAVRVDQDVKATDIAERLAKRKKLYEALDSLLKRLKLDGWLRINVALDLQAIQKRYADNQLKPKQLPAGLIVSDEREDITVKPLDQPERADAAA